MAILQRIVQRRRPAPAAEPADDEPATPSGRRPTEIEFAAYAEDCRVFGFYRLTADRLTDALNAEDAYELTDVLVVRLADSIGSQMKTLTVLRDELLAVRATGPRGDPGRRTRRRPSPITLQSGPYLIHGYVHGLPGADPVGEVRRRGRMVPLTESWIEYRTGGADHRARSGTLIVNRDAIDWVRPSKDEEVWLPDLPMETKPSPLAKDLTGHIYAGETD